MPLTSTTTATAATTTLMQVNSERSGPLAAHILEQCSDSDSDSLVRPSTPLIDYEFDESQCLFCNLEHPDLDQNLVHMSKAHGLHIDTTNLLVDLVSLIGYFHLVISGYYECLYCGTERNSRQAVQQHMIAKGHCKYDITDEESEFRDFYDLSSSETKNAMHQNLLAMRLASDPQLPSQLRSRRPRPLKSSGRQSPSIIAPLRNQSPPSPNLSSRSDATSGSNAAETSSHSIGELSTRAQKQESTLNNQLAHLRAGDRRSLLHLPASQQRALLATQHKQMEKSRRTEQTNQGNLATAGNTVNCLSKLRLIRKPPHTGNVSSLKH